MPKQRRVTDENKPVSFRPSGITRHQLDDLMEQSNENQTQIIIRAIERLWMLEVGTKEPKMKAKIVTKQGKNTPNGRERIMQLRSGEQGTGKVLGEVIYWPWSGPSCEQADKIINEIAERNDIEVVWEESD